MILSIESSCDDSSIAITDIKTKKIVFGKKISQDDAHSLYGGVVPELAARLHAKYLPKILYQAKEFFPKLKAVAVTNEPGLSVSLVEGVSMAKAISITLKIPIIAVHHLKGHIYSVFIEKDVVFPLLAMIVSGGHTMVVLMRSHNDIKEIASTKDDSLGESFDKVAKMLGFGYPGGPIIEQLARKGNNKRFSFTTPLQKSKELAFSYSGLKNSVRLKIEEFKDLSQSDKQDIAAAFEKTAFLHLQKKLEIIFNDLKPKNFALVGGVSANIALRAILNEICNKYNTNFYTAPLEFCSDNAQMIGRCALESYHLGQFAKLNTLDIKSRSKII